MVPTPFRYLHASSPELLPFPRIRIIGTSDTAIVLVEDRLDAHSAQLQHIFPRIARLIPPFPVSWPDIPAKS